MILGDYVDQGPRVAVDSSANVLSDEPPGRVVTLTDKCVVLDTSEDASDGIGYEVHQLG